QAGRPFDSASQLLDEDVAQSGFGYNIARGGVASELLDERKPARLLRGEQVILADELHDDEAAFVQRLQVKLVVARRRGPAVSRGRMRNFAPNLPEPRGSFHLLQVAKQGLVNCLREFPQPARSRAAPLFARVHAQSFLGALQRPRLDARIGGESI